MSLPFEPRCLPLLLGSLPSRGSAQALEVSRRYAGKLLAWPLLPQRNFREQSVIQGAIGFPGVILDEANQYAFVDRTISDTQMDRLALAYLENTLTYAALSADAAAGLSEFLRQSPDALRNVRAVKGQLIGPISLALQLTDEHQHPLIYDPAIFDAICQHLRLRLLWQAVQLSEMDRPAILCLNEPFLETVGQAFLPIGWDEAIGRIDEVLNSIVGCKGIYAPGAPDWTQVLRTSTDLIIADVYRHSDALIAAAEALNTFLEHDGIIGFGIVPGDPDELAQLNAATLLERLETIFSALEQAGLARERVLAQAVISSADELGGLSIEVAEQALGLIAQISEQLRGTYRLE